MKEQYKFTLKPLPYGYSDLEPYLSTRAMKTHHAGHLGGYIRALNEQIRQYPEYRGLSAAEIYAAASQKNAPNGETVRYLSSAVYNHNLYFSMLAPTADGAVRCPIGSLLAGIRRKYGSCERFIVEMRDRAMDIRGSGWVFLCRNEAGEPELLEAKNHSLPPLSKYTPITVLDCWEHAYYLDYLQVKKAFFENYFRIINWRLAELLWTRSVSYK